ncbi:MAG: hypothetical protein IH616_11085 [Gemmatimonadales bacterium]|nr:hypothetical protein [Gemmatimonadales bacterium]
MKADPDQPARLPEPPREEKMRDRTIAIGIAIGITLGAGIGVALDSVGLGIGAGLALGVIIGSVWNPPSGKPGDG